MFNKAVNILEYKVIFTTSVVMPVQFEEFTALFGSLGYDIWVLF